MSTTATFNGSSLPGIVVGRKPDPVKPKIQEHGVFGLTGNTQIVGGLDPSWLTLTLYLSGYASDTAIQSAIAALEAIAAAGTVGTVALSGEMVVSYSNCALREVNRVPFAGQADALPNDVDTPLSPWTQAVSLRFRRLA